LSSVYVFWRVCVSVCECQKQRGVKREGFWRACVCMCVYVGVKSNTVWTVIYITCVCVCVCVCVWVSKATLCGQLSCE